MSNFACMSRHVAKRASQRNKMTWQKMANILDSKNCVETGHISGFFRHHFVFYSQADQTCFFAIQDICTGTVVTVSPLNYQARLTWAISDEICERAKTLYEQHKVEKTRSEDEQRKAEAAQNWLFAKTFVVAMHYIDTLDHPETKKLMSIQAKNYGFEINNLLHDKHLPDLLQSRFEEINIQAKSISYISVGKGSYGTAHVIELQ